MTGPPARGGPGVILAAGDGKTATTALKSQIRPAPAGRRGGKIRVALATRKGKR